MSVDDLGYALRSVASIPLGDGTSFDPDGYAVTEAFGGTPRGVRSRVPGNVGSAQMQLVIDVTFDQPVTPGPELCWHHGLASHLPPVRLACCPRETMVAEKLAIAVEFGPDNTRIRDFFDIWFLTTRRSLHGRTMQAAIERTFAARTAGSFLRRDDGYWAQGFAPAFATSVRERAWMSFLEQYVPRMTVPEFRDVVAAVSRFAMPLLTSERDQFTIDRWSPGTGWKIRNRYRVHETGRYLGPARPLRSWNDMRLTVEEPRIGAPIAATAQGWRSADR
jgi:hypothetical protein